MSTVAATRTVDALLRQLTPTTASNAADRAILSHTLSHLAYGTAAALAELQEHLHSARRFGSRDRHLAAVEAAMYHAADLVEVAADHLTDTAEECSRAVIAADTVTYHGSLTTWHGLYRLNGPCTCDGCLDVGPGLELGHPTSGQAVLTCVAPEHITAQPHAVDPALTTHATTAGTRLHAAHRALPAPLTAVDAVPLVRALDALTGRHAAAVGALAAAIENAPKVWMLDTALPHAFNPRWRHPRHRIHDSLTHATAALADARARLRTAIATLARIADQPHPITVGGRR